MSHGSDFYELSQLYGSPPKVLWLRAGNLATASTAKLLVDNHMENGSEANAVEINLPLTPTPVLGILRNPRGGGVGA